MWLAPAPLTTPPVAAGPLLCVGAADGNVYVLEGTTEARRFRTAGRWIRGRLAAGDGVVYAAGSQRTLHAFEAATGRELWRRESPTLLGSPVLDGATLLVGEGGALLALDRRSGGERWRAAVEGALPAIECAPAPEGVYAAAPGAGLLLLERGTGRTLWRTPLPGPPESPPVPLGGRVAVRCGPLLHLFRASDGAAEGEPHPAATAPVAAAGLALFAERAERVRLRDSSGRILHEEEFRPSPRGPLLADPVADGGRALFAVDETLLSWDVEKRALRGRFAAPGRILFLGPGPTVVAEGGRLCRIALDN